VAGQVIGGGCVVTTGLKGYNITVSELAHCATTFFIFLDGIPPRDTEMWVVHKSSGTPRQTTSGI